MSVSYWLDHSSQEEIHVDVTIIGGGITGISIAYWLLKEDSSLNVLLVEKNKLAGGASGRNAGFITCGSVEHFNRLVELHGRNKAAEIWRFSEINLKLLKEHIIPEDPSAIEFEQNGSFSLASTEQELNELKKSAELMKSFDLAVEVLESDGVQERLGTTKFVGGIKYLDDASVNPVKLIHHIKDKCFKISNNFQILESSEVHSIEDSVVYSEKAKIKSDLIILATNGYSCTLDPYFNDKVHPTRGQILCTEPLESKLEAPCYANFVLDYFRQTSSGELLIGGFRQLQKDAEVGFSDETTEVIQKALEEFIENYLPFAQGKKITHRWSGIMGFSSDGQPLIGSLPHSPQTFFAVGYTAHGLGLSFHCAKALIDMIYERPFPDFISAKRF